MLLGLLSFSMLGVLHKVADVKTEPTAARSTHCCRLSSLRVRVPVRAVRHGERTGGTAASWRWWPFRSASARRSPSWRSRPASKHGNIATSWLAINLSAGIPTVASILIYDEPVGVGKALALALIPVSMFLLWKDKKAAGASRAIEAA